MSDIYSPTSFIVYRYLLTKSDCVQGQFFQDLKGPEDAHNRRKDLMCDALDSLPTLSEKGKMHFWKEPTGKQGEYLFHVQLETQRTVEQDFKQKSVKHEPSAWLAINTDENCQTIAVEDVAQPRHQNVIKRLTTFLQPYFQERGLVLVINAISQENKFWDYVKANRSQIREVIFTISPPNMAGLNTSIAKEMSSLAEATQAQKIEVSVTSRRKQELELQTDNVELAELVNSVENGGGNYAFKLRSSDKLRKPERVERDIVAAPKEENTLIEKDIDDPHTSILTKIKHFFTLNRKNP